MGHARVKPALYRGRRIDVSFMRRSELPGECLRGAKSRTSAYLPLQSATPYLRARLNSIAGVVRGSIVILTPVNGTLRGRVVFQVSKEKNMPEMGTAGARGGERDGW